MDPALETGAVVAVALGAFRVIERVLDKARRNGNGHLSSEEHDALMKLPGMSAVADRVSGEHGHLITMADQTMRSQERITTSLERTAQIQAEIASQQDRIARGVDWLQDHCREKGGRT